MTKQENVTTPTIQEIVGITTALSGMASAEDRLNAAVISADGTEKKVIAFREELNKKMSDPMFAMLLKAQPGLPAQMESEIADSSRKAVNDAIKEFNMHVGTVQTLTAQLKAKYGKVEATTKGSDSGKYGNVTTGNMDSIRDTLHSRGFTNVSFELLEDGKHYAVVGTNADGRNHKGRHSSNVIRDWY